MSGGASIYILLCADGSYYTGVTRRSVEERFSEHANGLIPGCYTFFRRPVRLVHSERHERIDEAVATERRIKGWSRAKKQAYINADYERLSQNSPSGGVAAAPDCTSGRANRASFEAPSGRLRTRAVLGAR